MTTAQTLLQQARDVLQRGDPQAALGLIAQAAAHDPSNPEIWMARGVCLRAAGDALGALEAIERVLTLDPSHFFGLISKGALAEQLSGTKAAARIFRDALKIAPADDQLPPALRKQVEHARRIVAEDAEALSVFISDRLGQEGLNSAPPRFRESLDIMLGRARPFVQQPLYFHYPQLPAIPYYPREMFPWLGELEAATDMVTDELEGALDTLARDFEPYIQYPEGAPVNQWAELNHSEKWSTLHLWRDGRAFEDAQAQCPQTTALLNALPMARQPGFGPTAMFSRLEPHTTIPAHTGSSNVRLIVHLPLILPGPARFRVGNETRAWTRGEAWVFDDTIEHEAWNDADSARVILIFDVWNPFLSEGERELVTALMLARRDYNTT